MVELNKKYKIGVRRFSFINWIGFYSLYKKETLRFLIVSGQTILGPVVTAILFLMVISLAIGENRGVALGVVTADCVPIILYDTQNQIIACIHAGWKGASSGIIENTVKKFKKFNSKNKIFASVGPCIGLKNYEVDLDFYKRFVTKSKNNTTYFLKKNKFKKLFNLRKYVNDKLVRLKVKVDHVNHDTFKEKSRFFSYRRSQKLGDNDYGRSISVISLTNFSQN